MALKKSTIKKTKAALSRGTIGAPNTDPPPGGNGGGDTSTPPPLSTPPATSGDGKNWVKPKNYDTPFVPEGIPNDDNWHHDDAHIVSEHMMNYGKHPLDVVRFWMQDDGARLKNAQPFDPQHGDYGGFGAPGNPHPTGPPGYVGDVGSSAPTTKTTKKPSGDQHASTSVGSYSAETIRYMPGSAGVSVTNGMTNRDKYKY